MKSIRQIREEVSLLIKNEACDESILTILGSQGDTLFQHEDALWDYKLKFGIEGLAKAHPDRNFKICQIVKDIVAFSNTAGGYIIFGVENVNKKYAGCSESIPADEILISLYFHVSFVKSLLLLFLFRGEVILQNQLSS
jgi:Putative DNA-binding domain